MAEAVRAARAGVRGANPLVGAVVLDPSGRMATGFHAGAGTPHAEVQAIAAAEAADFDLSQCTIYVTLEPCSHVGRTPACAALIIEKQIPRVVYAMADPNPTAAGGAQMLRDAGVSVRNQANDEAERLNERWAMARREKRPFVTAKIAQSIDGRIAARDLSSQWITSPETRAEVHQLRARCDAVLVGTGTALIDDPRLTVRGIDGPQPRPVVMGMRELEPGSHLARNPDTIYLRTRSPREALEELGRRGVEHVLVEGGAGIFASFVEAGLVDELYVHIGPILLGGEGLPVTGSLLVPTLSAAPRFEPDELATPAARTLGPDTVLHFRPASASTTE